MIDWEVNDQIVCVDTDFIVISRDEEKPTLGRIYTIREILIADDTACVRLKEIHNKPIRSCSGFTGLVEVSWYHWHFKKTKRVETDISAFKELLNPSPCDVTKYKIEERILEDA